MLTGVWTTHSQAVHWRSDHYSININNHRHVYTRFHLRTHFSNVLTAWLPFVVLRSVFCFCQTVNAPSVRLRLHLSRPAAAGQSVVACETTAEQFAMLHAGKYRHSHTSQIFSPTTS
jgi:hypothetical protein